MFLFIIVHLDLASQIRNCVLIFDVRINVNKRFFRCSDNIHYPNTPILLFFALRKLKTPQGNKDYLTMTYPTKRTENYIFTDHQRNGEGNVFSCVCPSLSHSARRGCTMQCPSPSLYRAQPLFCTRFCPSSPSRRPQTCSNLFNLDLAVQPPSSPKVLPSPNTFNVLHREARAVGKRAVSSRLKFPLVSHSSMKSM